MVFLKKSVSAYFKFIREFECGVVFEIVEDIFASPTIFIACYLPPINSPFFKGSQTNGMEILDVELSELKVMFPHHCILMSGDLNARTKDWQDFIQDDSSVHLPLPNFYIEDNFKQVRKSKDTHGELNEYGKLLLELCCTFDIHFLNGRSFGDMNGEAIGQLG